MLYQKNIIFFIKIFFFIGISINAKFLFPEKPKKIYPINDYSRVLNSNEINILNKKLINFNKKKSIEIVISIVDTINGEDISMIATKWGEIWKIGEKKESNGIFILLARKEKKISIQTGYGIEPYLTDIICKKIINKIIPYLKKEEYYLSIEKIINFLFENLNNYDNKKIKKYHNINEYYILIIFIIIIIYLFLKKNKKNSYYEDQGSLIPPNPNIFEHKYDNYDNNEDDDFDGFGGGGKFGGGGASSNW